MQKEKPWSLNKGDNTEDFFFFLKNKIQGVPIVVQWVTNPTSVHKDALASLSGLRI